MAAEIKESDKSRETLETWKKLPSNERMEQLLRNFDYELNFNAEQDNEKMKKCMKLLVNRGFLKRHLDEKFPNGNHIEIWLNELGRYLINKDDKEFKLSKVAVRHEYILIYYSCINSEQFQQYVKKKSRPVKVVGNRKLKLESKLRAVSMLLKTQEAMNFRNDYKVFENKEELKNFNGVIKLMYKAINTYFDFNYTGTQKEEQETQVIYNYVKNHYKDVIRKQNTLTKVNFEDEEKKKEQAEKIDEYEAILENLEHIIKTLEKAYAFGQQKRKLAALDNTSINQSLATVTTTIAPELNPHAKSFTFESHPTGYRSGLANMRGQTSRQSGIFSGFGSNNNSNSNNNNNNYNGNENFYTRSEKSRLTRTSGQRPFSGGSYFSPQGQMEDYDEDEDQDDPDKLNQTRQSFERQTGGKHKLGGEAGAESQDTQKQLQLQQQIQHLERQNQLLQLQNNEMKDKYDGLQHQVRDEMFGSPNQNRHNNNDNNNGNNDYELFAGLGSPNIQTGVYGVNIPQPQRQQRKSLAEQEIEKSQIKSAFLFKSQYAGYDEGNDYAEKLIQWVKDVRDWNRVYGKPNGVIPQITMVKHLLAQNLIGSAKRRVLNKNEKVPFQTVKALLAYLLEEYGGDQYYKIMESELEHYEILDYSNLERIVDDYEDKVREFHSALELSNLDETEINQKKWTNSKIFNTLLQKLDIELKQEIIKRFGKPANITVLQNELATLASENRWLYSTSKKIMGKDHSGNANVRKLNINYNRFNNNQGFNQNSRFNTRGGYGQRQGNGNRGGYNYRGGYGHRGGYGQRGAYGQRGRRNYDRQRNRNDYNNNNNNNGQQWIQQFDPDYGKDVDHSGERKLQTRCYQCNSQYHISKDCTASDEVKEKFGRWTKRQWFQTMERKRRNGRPSRGYRGGYRGRGRYYRNGDYSLRRERDKGRGWHGNDKNGNGYRKINNLQMANEEEAKDREGGGARHQFHQTDNQSASRESWRYNGNNNDHTPTPPSTTTKGFQFKSIRLKNQKYEILKDDLTNLRVNAVKCKSERKLSKYKTAEELQMEVKQGFDLTMEDAGEIWIVEGTFSHDYYGKVNLLLQADTGSTALCANSRLAHKYLHDEIERIKTPVKATLANSQHVTVKERVLTTWSPAGGDPFHVWVYLIDELNVPLLASLRFLRRLGFQVTGRSPTTYIWKNQQSEEKSRKFEKLKHELEHKMVEHDTEDDPDLSEIENFKKALKIPATPHDELIQAKLLKMEANQSIVEKEIIINKLTTTTACEAIKVDDHIIDRRKLLDIELELEKKRKEAFDIEWNKNEKELLTIRDELIKDPTNEKWNGKCKELILNLITRFKATEKDLKEAIESCDDKIYGEMDLRGLTKEFGKEKAEEFKKLASNYKEAFAYGRYDYGCIKNQVYHLGVKPENRNKTIYAKQFHLPPGKFKAFCFDTIKKYSAGIYEDDKGSRNNVCVLIIKKTVTTDDGKTKTRMRTAHDFHLLNQLLENRVTITPTQGMVNSILGGPGPVMVFDLANCFESWILAEEDRHWTKFESPIGPLRMARATYGTSTIMSTVQAFNHKTFVQRMKDIIKGVIFVDDGAYKYRPGVTFKEICNISVKLWELCIEVGYKLNPVKFNPYLLEYIFIGTHYDTYGYEPTKEFIQKCIKFALPRSSRDVKCFLSTLRFLDQYCYDMAGAAEPLAILESKQQPWKWEKKQQSAFKTLKKMAERAFKLKFPKLEGQMMMHSDASGVAMAIVYLQKQWNKLLKRDTYFIIGFYSKRLPKYIRDSHAIVQEVYAGVHGANKRRDLLARFEYLWVTDCINVKALIDNRGMDLILKPILIRLRRLIADLKFRVIHVNAEWVPMVDYLNRCGEHGQHQDTREAERAARLRERLKHLKTLSFENYIHQCHDWKDLDIQNGLVLEEKQFEFKTNDEYYDYQRSLIGLEELQHGNLDILYNGVDFTHSYDFQSILNTKTFTLSMNQLMDNYTYLTRNESNQLTFNYLDQNQTLMIKSVITSNIKASDMNETLKILNHELFKKYDTSLDYQMKRLSNPLALWKSSKSHGFMEHPECGWPKNQNKLQINTASIINKKQEKQLKLQYDLAGGNEVSPFNLTTKFPKSILKTKERGMIYPKRVKQVDAVQLEKNLKLAKWNMLANMDTCEIITARRVFSIRSISDNLTINLNNLRRSPRLAKKKRVTYYDQAEQLPESQQSGYDGYVINIPDTLNIDKTKYFTFFRKLKESYPMEATRKIFDLNHFQSCQRGDAHVGRTIEYLESNDKEILNQFNEKRDKYWLKLLQRGYFKITNNLLYYYDSNFNNLEKEGRLVAPDILKIPIVIYYHHSIHHIHGGAAVTEAYIAARFWWHGLSEDVSFIVKSCDTCNQVKGRNDNLPLNSWYTEAPGELMVYDCSGPYFNRIYFSGMLDDFSNKIQLRVINACDAPTIATLLFNHWAPEHGFPVQMIGDLGSSNYNDLLSIIHETFGISGIYSSPRYHVAIGKIERRFREVNKYFKTLNVDLAGTVSDHLNIEEAIFQIQQFLPSVEMYINSSINLTTGLSPNMIDKGRQLRGIGDIKHAIETLRNNIKKGASKRSQIEFLQDLQKRLKYYAHQRQEILLPYLLRNMNKHVENEARKYKRGEYVGYYVGDMKSKNVQKWQARYHKAIFLGELNSGQVEILDLHDNLKKQTTKRYLKKYLVNDPLWKDEFDYQMMKDQQQQEIYHKQGGKQVKFME